MWEEWAKNVSLAGAPGHVLRALAQMADACGVAYCSTDFLATRAHVSRPSVFRALSALEKEGFLSREKRRKGVRQDITRYQLHRARAADAEVLKPADISKGGNASKGSKGGNIVVFDPFDFDPENSSLLRSLIHDARLEGFSGPASEKLSQVVCAHGGRQFGAAIRRGVELSGMNLAESTLDTMSIAWEALIEYGKRLESAQHPWSLLTRYVLILSQRRDFPKRPGIGSGQAVEVPYDMPALDLALSSDAVPTVIGEGTGVESVAYDDFGPLMAVVDALIDEGMEASLAWISTRRVVELALCWDKGRRLIAVRNDPVLASFGIPALACEALMKLVAGSRGASAQAFIELSETELHERAREITALTCDFAA